MDILYVVGTGSQWQNNELRYSLRSIAKNGKNIGRVFLVGYKPDFVSDKVIHIPCDDPGDVKHNNILHKVLFAAYNSQIDSHFLISSDDHYYMKPTDFNRLPVYYRKETIPERYEGTQMWNEYFISLHDTRYLLLENDLTIYQTNPHCNTHFDVGIYEKYRKIFDKGMQLPHGAELNCLMGNLLRKEGWELQPFYDAKLGNKCSMADIEKKVRKAECLSSVDGMGESQLAKYLEREFNKKCKYEI